MKETKAIKVNDYSEIPNNFTGIVEYANGDKSWLKEGKHHREDGPAVEYADGGKTWLKEGKVHRVDGPACEWINGLKLWYLESKLYSRLSLKNYVVLVSYQGEYNLIWYKLLNEYKIFEYPDIPGLIEK